MFPDNLDNYINFLKANLKLVAEFDLNNPTNYLDLSNDLSPKELKEILIEDFQDYIPVDPMIVVFEAILTRVDRDQIDRVKIGVNELLKSLLQSLNEKNEKSLTDKYLYRVRLIFKRSLSGGFPYYDDLWDYISNSFNTVGIYLLDANFLKASKLLLETTAKLGKIAAQKGLATSSTQWCLRNLENKAISLNLIDLGNLAKNFRFNLESY